jgi:phosphoribosyl 1,2-cyclic phosphodiesterase
MRLASLGSGSKGNATLVESDNTCILIDCGFSLKETTKRLSRLGRSVDDLDAVLVTHEHSDHIKGVATLAKKHKVPVYMSHGTANSQKELAFEVKRLNCHGSFTIGNIEIQPVPVPHDAREPCQFVFSQNNFRLGVLTDLGHISSIVFDRYKDCDLLLVEANHDVEMLYQGPYPESLKQRVAGDWGHLSNRQTMDFLQAINHDRLQKVVLGHISETNNSTFLVENCLSDVSKLQADVVLAYQNDGSHWLFL